MKIKAFTLVELIVVMIISTLVVGSLWTMYRFIQKRYGEAIDDNNRAEEILLFDQILREEFLESEYVTLTNASNLIFFFEGKPNVEYEFGKTFLARNQSGRTDTIRAALNRIDANYLNNSSGMKKIVSLYFQLDYMGRLYDLFYIKRYASRDLFNNPNI